MAQSGTRTFSLNHTQLLDEALRLARVISIDNSGNTDQRTVATRFLNSMVAEWANRGVFLWSVVDVDIELAVDQIEYTDLDQTYWTIDVTNHYVKDIATDEDTVVEAISWHEYSEMPDKAGESESADPTGLTQKIAFKPATSGTHTLYIWPAPRNSTDVLHVSALRKLQDFDGETDDPDFGSNWYMALLYGLASHLARIDGAELT